MKIDILMATYNGEKYLDEQINSILNQTFTDFTLHISDDKSSDTTREILKKYQKKDKRINLYFQDNNLGYIKNFEFLMTKSTNPYIMLCDQDDVWMNNKVELSLDKIEKEKLDLVVSNLCVVDASLNTISSSYFRKLNLSKNFTQSSTFDLGSLILKNPAAGCAIIFKQTLLKHLLPFPDLKAPYYVHDWYILVVSHAYGRVGYLDIPLSKYRQHGNNSIGMYMQKKGRLNFFLNARTVNIDYRISFCNELLKRIKNDRQIEIKEALAYFTSLKKTKFINLHFLKYFKYTEMMNYKLKIKYLIVFHFPLFILSIKK